MSTRHEMAEFARPGAYEARLKTAIQTLHSDDPDAKRCVIRTLYEMGELARAAAPDLLILAKGDGPLSYCALEALVETGDPSCVEPLVARCAKNCGRNSGGDYAYLLAKTRDLRAVPALVRIAGNVDDIFGSESATCVLYELGPPVVTPLLAALSSQDSDVCQGAAVAVRILSANGQSRVPLTWCSSGEYSHKALLDVEATPSLIAALDNKDVLVRTQVARALGNVRDARAIPRLIRALTDEDGYVGYPAADALGKLRAREAVEPLIHALRRPAGDASVRLAAARALALIGGEHPIGVLAGQLKSDDADARANAALALGECDDRDVTIRLLLTSLDDTDSKVRHYVIAALVRLNAVQATARICEVLRRESGINCLESDSVEALRVLGGRDAVSLLCDALQCPNSGSRWLAARALGELAGTEALQSIWDALPNEKDEAVRFWMKVAIARSEGRTVLDVVRKSYRASSRKGAPRDPQSYEWNAATCVKSNGQGFPPPPFAFPELSWWDAETQQLAADDVAFLRELYRDGHRLRPVEALANRLDAGNVRIEGVCELLLTAVQDEDESVRVNAAWGLRNMRSRRIVTALIEDMGIRNWDIRSTIVDLLCRQTGRNFGHYQGEWRQWWKSNQAAFPETVEWCDPGPWPIRGQIRHANMPRQT